MDVCVYEDDPEITGRGVLVSLYIQGLLLVLNGLLSVDKHELGPSLFTIIGITAVVFWKVVTEDSVYLAAVLHLLLCFHVLALQAVIVWIAEKSRLLAWRLSYGLSQLIGWLLWFSSMYAIIAYKECARNAKGFILNHELPMSWFLLLSVVPMAFSTVGTWTLHYLLKKFPELASRSGRLPVSKVHFLYVLLWTSSLAVVIILLESARTGYKSILKGADVNDAWSFGQILPLALAVTPGWLFVRYIVEHIKEDRDERLSDVQLQSPTANSLAHAAVDALNMGELVTGYNVSSQSAVGGGDERPSNERSVSDNPYPQLENIDESLDIIPAQSREIRYSPNSVSYYRHIGTPNASSTNIPTFSLNNSALRLNIFNSAAEINIVGGNFQSLETRRPERRRSVNEEPSEGDR